MSVVSIQLSESLQALIDSRLDTIDRILLGRLPRQDRLTIVKEVESQIYEQLHERDAEDLSRHDVLSVLATLDPPEAYLPEGAETNADSVPHARPASGTRPLRKSDPQRGRTSGIVGICSLALPLPLLLPLTYAIAVLFGSEILLFAGIVALLALMFTGGLLSSILGYQSKGSGSWAVVGLVTGILSLLLSVMAALGVGLFFVFGL